jgi:ArsR family transcriptional regulator, arsenate/arsenite/antimonite-responsive transcriptional repressor
VTVRREGRSMIYAAQYEAMNELLAYLTENCCQGRSCTPARRKPALPVASRRRETVS